MACRKTALVVIVADAMAVWPNALATVVIKLGAVLSADADALCPVPVWIIGAPIATAGAIDAANAATDAPASSARMD